MQITFRPFRSDEDFHKVRSLLDETYPITPTGYNWEVRRWDGWRYYKDDTKWNPAWEEQVCLWRTEAGKLVGVVHPEGPGVAFLQLHPDFRRIEEEMVSWAEQHLASPTIDGNQRRLSTYVFEYDSPRKILLERRGWKKESSGGVLRRLRLGLKRYAHPVIADGYQLRPTRPDDHSDCQRLADLINAAFNRDFHTASEFMNFAAKAECFRSDLSLAAVAPDGSFAAYVAASINGVHNCGIFEPVCTHPDHRRKSLAQTLMSEGLVRLQALDATDVYVSTGDQVAANLLYDSMGFTEAYQEREWTRLF